MATVTQVENIYWDLVSAYEQAQVNEQSVAFAQHSLDNARKQLQLQSIPAMDVMRAEAEVSKRDQDLTVARTSLQLQELLMKNALTKSLDDPVLESVNVVPTDRAQTGEPPAAKQSVQALIGQALHDRPELQESDVDLVNRQISRTVSGGLLRRVGFGRTVESGLQHSGCAECFDRADGLRRSSGEFIQQHRARLLRWIQFEYSAAKSRC